MKEADFTIRGTDVIGVNYKYNMKNKPGEKINIKVKNGVKIVCNPASPMIAMVRSRFEAKDESGNIEFQLDTITPVQASTYVDDLEDQIKEKCMDSIRLAINEKVRAVSTLIGLNLQAPPVVIKAAPDEADNKDEDNLIDFNF